MVVLGQDIMTIDPLKIIEIPVLKTMTNGKFVYVNPNQDPVQKTEYFRYPTRAPYMN